MKMLIIHQYVNIIENRIAFKIKTGHYPELFTPETIKLLGNTESKITKNKNGKDVLDLEITELVLVHYNLFNNDYEQDSRILYIFVSNKPFGSLLEISPKKSCSLKKHSIQNFKKSKYGLQIKIVSHSK